MHFARSNIVHRTRRFYAWQLFVRYLNVKSTLYKFAPLMRKVLIRFVLLQFFLLLSGYSYQYAHASHYCSTSFVALNNSIANLSSAKNNHSIISNSEQGFKIEIAEIEEENNKFFSFDKYLTGGNFFTTLFADLTPGHFFDLIKENESIVNSVQELIFNRPYITFRVFRI